MRAIVAASRERGRRLFSSLLTHDHFHLIPNVISASEESVLMSYIDPLVKRKRYEGDHWDSVIVSYKEMELLPMSNRGVPMPAEVRVILERMHNILRANYKFPIVDFLPPHAIDLASTGHIDYHVDSVKHSGRVLAGLSLLSARTMRLRLQSDVDGMTASRASSREQVPWSAAEVSTLLHARSVCINAVSHTGASDAQNTQATPQSDSHGGCDWEKVASIVNRADEEMKDKKLLRSAVHCQNKYLALMSAQRSSSPSSSPTETESGSSGAGASALPQAEAGGDFLEVRLPPRSLYLLEGPLRYAYGHALLGSDHDPDVQRRISIIFRDPRHSRNPSPPSHMSSASVSALEQGHEQGQGFMNNNESPASSEGDAGGDVSSEWKAGYGLRKVEA
jgi:hypothetical protein